MQLCNVYENARQVEILFNVQIDAFLNVLVLKKGHTVSLYVDQKP